MVRLGRLPGSICGMPCPIGVIQLHLLNDLEGVWPQILLMDNSCVTDDKSLHTGDSVFCRHGHKCKPSDHRPLHQEIHFAQRRCGSLSFQDFEVVAMVGFGPAGIPLRQGFGYPFANWSAPTTILVFPGKSVLLPGRTDDPLCVLMDSVTGLERIFVLDLYIATANSESIQFVGPDASSENLLTSFPRIEKPSSTSLHDWNWVWPLLVANRKHSSTRPFRIRCHLGLFACLLR